MDDVRPLGSARRHEVLKFLRRNGSASIASLTSAFDVSAATVHRDLEALTAQGLVERVHGGARAIDHDDPPVDLERHKSVDEKRQIAQAAADLVTDDITSVFFEAGTTVAEVAHLLRDRPDLVFVTNGPEIALDLAQGRSEVVLIGGNLRQRTGATVGPMALNALADVHIDLAFVGVSAVDEEGLSSMNPIEAQMKSAIINAADQVWALGDGSKLGRRALVPVAPLSSLDGLVTNTHVDIVWPRRFTLILVEESASAASAIV